MFWRWRNTVARFMNGRYGIDSLGWCLMILYGVFYIVGWFFPARSPALRICGGVSLLILVLFFWRALSRNPVRRQAENERYLRIRRAVQRWFGRQRDRIRYIRRYRFRQCPYCRARLRLPLRRGVRTVTCSRCGGRFKRLFL